jgi:energy-coupling factor transporter ATP-binding protein EcfA2
MEGSEDDDYTSIAEDFFKKGLITLEELNNVKTQIKNEKGFVEQIYRGIKSLKEKKIVIIVIGPTGIGKSTLINYLFGDCGVLPGYKTSSVGTGTFEVNSNNDEVINFGGLELIVVDTPGFRDQNVKYNEAIKKINKYNDYPKIYLFSFNMPSLNRETDDLNAYVSAFNKFVKERGDYDLWKSIIITFLRGNEHYASILKLPEIKKFNPRKADPDYTSKKILYNQKVIEKFTSDFELMKSFLKIQLSNNLKEDNVNMTKINDILSNLNFQIAGELEEDEDCQDTNYGKKLPGIDNWRSDFFNKIIQVLNNSPDSVVALTNALEEKGQIEKGRNFELASQGVSGLRNRLDGVKTPQTSGDTKDNPTGSLMCDELSKNEKKRKEQYQKTVKKVVEERKPPPIVLDNKTIKVVSNSYSAVIKETSSIVAGAGVGSLALWFGALTLGPAGLLGGIVWGGVRTATGRSWTWW